MRFSYVILTALIAAFLLNPADAFAQRRKRFTKKVTAPLTLFNANPEGADALLTEEQQILALKKVEDFGNIFYKNCVQANKEPSLDMYVKSQCACSAAEMPNAITLPQAQRLFGLVPNAKIDYPYNRFMTLAYIPCMETTARDFVYDQCMDNKANDKLKMKGQICECIADGMREYVSTFGLTLVPGLTDKGLDPNKGIDNPLAFALQYKGFSNRAEYKTAVCTQKKEFGW